MTKIPSVLEISNLSKSYGSRAAVESLSFSIHEGDIFGFLGPNGAGKTTTIKMIVGLIRPSAGTLSYFNGRYQNPSKSVREQIGALVESPVFHSYLTGRKNLQLLGRLYSSIPPSQINDLLELSGLSKRADEKVGTYSLGMRQRLGLAQALLNKPPFVILDEPTNGLDPQGIMEFRDTIRRLNAEWKTTFLISSHLLSEIEQVCNRIAIINHGKICVAGLVKDLHEAQGLKLQIRAKPLDLALNILRPIISSLKGGAANNIELPGDDCLRFSFDGKRSDEFNDLLVRGGVRVYEMKVINPTLEEVFLHATGFGTQPLPLGKAT